MRTPLTFHDVGLGPGGFACSLSPALTIWSDESPEKAGRAAMRDPPGFTLCRDPEASR